MFHALMLKLGFAWIGGQLRAIAEGKKGPLLLHVYDWLVGKKTVTGLLLGAVAVALLSLGYVKAAGTVLAIAGLLVPLGLADAAWRLPPRSLNSLAWYTFLRDHWPWVAGVLGTVAVRFQTCDPDVLQVLAKLHLSCAVALAVVTVWSALGAWLVGAAALTTEPQRPIVLEMLQARAKQQKLN